MTQNCHNQTLKKCLLILGMFHKLLSFDFCKMEVTVFTSQSKAVTSLTCQLVIMLSVLDLVAWPINSGLVWSVAKLLWPWGMNYLSADGHYLFTE